MTRLLPWLVTASLALTTVAACDSDDEKPAAAAGATTPSATPSTAPAPPVEPAAPPLDPPDWQSARHGGQPVGLERAGRGFFGLETRAVARLSATGADAWRYEGPADDDFGGFVVDGIPVAAPVSDPRSKATYRAHDVHGLDPRTGRVMWSHRATSSYTFTDGDHVVVPTCTGAETGTVGDCTLTAYDPETGGAVWSVRTYADVEESWVGNDVAVVQTFPTGDQPRFVVLDTDTGAVTATVSGVSGHLELVGDTLVATTAAHASGDSGCRQRVTAYALDGTIRWQRFVMVPLQNIRKKECAEYDAFAAGDDVALSTFDKAPALLLDGRSGHTLWRDTQNGAEADGLAAGVLVLGGDSGTRGVDPATGQTVWSYDTPTGFWLLWRHYAATNYSCDTEPSAYCTVVLDARTGADLLHLAGVPEQFVPGRGDTPPGLMVRVDDSKKYAATYAYVTLT